MKPEQAAELRKPFPASAVGKLPKPTQKNAPKGQCRECGGYHGLPAVHLDYVGHAATTDRLLSIDPEWSWEPMALDQFGSPQLDRDGNLWIRLTVCGVTRIGCGDGSSMKERIGDAIRNAAMRFGVALDLWSKEELEQAHGPAAPLPFSEHGHNQAPAAPPAPESAPEPPAEKPAAKQPAPVSKAQLAKIGACMSDLGMTDRDLALQYVADVIGRGVESRNDLTKAEAHKLIEALEHDLRPAENGEPS